MESTTKVLICVAFSLAAHGAFLASQWTFLGHEPQDVPDDQIQISYVNIVPPPVSEVQPMPVRVIRPEAKVFARSQVPAKSLIEVVSPPILQTGGGAAVKKSEELLLDPQKGKLFSAYFTSVKTKIEHTVKDRYTREFSANGTITLFFILTADGRLENAEVIQKTGRGSDVAKEFAMGCLKASAPFGSFPRQLSSDKISFNISVRFE